MVDAAAERHMADLALLQATMSALWAPGLGEQLRKRVALRSVSDLIVRTLTAGAESGDIAVAADPQLVAAMIRDAYVSALSRAAQQGVTLEAVKRRAKEEVEIILAGARKV
jgi:hypothetical protein